METPYNPGYWYLATPYSKFPGGSELAFEEACRQVALFFKSNICVFSPIAHSHGIAKFGQLDTPQSFPWLKFDFPMIRLSQGLILCEMDSWRASAGMSRERVYALRIKKPVVYMTPGVIPEVCLAPSF